MRTRTENAGECLVPAHQRPPQFPLHPYTFYRFEVGLAASLVKSFDLKVAYLVDYKNVVPPTLKKTDTALIAAIIYKF